MLKLPQILLFPPWVRENELLDPMAPCRSLPKRHRAISTLDCWIELVIPNLPQDANIRAELFAGVSESLLFLRRHQLVVAGLD